ncbi:MAG TPA: RecX family transcriptional regulator [Candidatus Saccharimonadales bacterium]|nr:RecX family transcriptional regulator [Candidatus Saccharimonadales bacterium]
MTITAIKEQTTRSNWFSVYVDGRYSFSLNADSLLTSKLAVGAQLNEQRLQQLRYQSEEDKAYERTLRYVMIRLRSEWEVRTYLKRKAIEGEHIQQIVERLRSQRLIDDEAFARNWVTSRQSLKKASKRRMSRELQQKHIDETIISTILSEDSVDERRTLRQLVEQKRRQPRYRHDELRLMQYLSRQGYSYGDIKAVLGELQVS